MKFCVHLARMVAVAGTTATLVSALLFGAPAAQASTKMEKIFLVRPNGTSFEAPAGTDVRSLSGPYYRWEYPADVNDCQPGEMCMWSENHFSGWGVYMGGPWPYCAGMRFEKTFWQDHTNSIWNRVYPGTSSLWNRASDGSYRYSKYAYVNPGYSHDTNYTRYIDAWAYDPAQNCRTEMLHLSLVDV